MNISILAAGAGGMYCGSCMRDSSLAVALRKLGHSVTLIPLYTPLRNERDVAATQEVFYGGINVYLQHATRLFRKTPRALDWVFDRPWLLNLAGRIGAQMSPEKLVGLTVDVLEGEDGAASKELHRLTEFLRDEIKPSIICLPNLMFVGMAKEFRERLGVPVICEMTGEDIFLDAMKSADREQVRQIIRTRARDISRFVATSHFYADRMSEYLGVDRSTIDIVYTGLSEEYFTPTTTRDPSRPFTIGFMARACPEKGLGLLIDAMARLVKLPGMASAKLKVAGYLGARDEKWYAALQKRANAEGLASSVEWLGEVDRESKISLLDSIDVFTVPTTIEEPKGISILEAMARGVPVVQPSHGSFPELVNATGGGLLVKPNDAEALAQGLAEILRDPGRRAELGGNGRAAIRERFTEQRMASEMLAIFQEAINHNGVFEKTEC